MKMLDQQQDIEQRAVYGRHHEPMLWIARLLSLAPGIFIAIMNIREVLRRLRTDGPSLDFVNFVMDGEFFLVLSLIPAVIAWRWHRLGGILLILTGCAILGYDIHLISTFEGTWNFGPVFYLFYMLIPFSLIITAGGVLHIVYWYKEKSPRSS